MQKIIPPRLQSGDEIRIIAPSDSLKRVGGKAANQAALQKLNSWGYHVSFGAHVAEDDLRQSSAISSRITDLHTAFEDPNVKAILSVIGGFTSNELLPYLDFNLINANPKIICGFSDFTALANAITANTGLVTYYGPAFATLKMTGELGDYQDCYFKTALTTAHYTLSPSKNWASYAWFDPTASPNLTSNQWEVYTAGHAVGQAVGGNLDTLNLLNGTDFQPDYAHKILLAEFSEDQSWLEFTRDLAALLQVAENPGALLIGRFPLETKMSRERLLFCLDKFPILKKIPVMFNVNFGHAQPIFTIPLGETIEVDTSTQTIVVS